MGRPLMVLVVEDSVDDAAVTLRELKRAGFDASWERVETAAALRAALPKRTWDLCISDFSLPSFGAAEALEIVRTALPHLPFFVVSGVVGEERALALMRAGADDYFLKGHLARLGAAVDRAVDRAALLGRSELKQQRAADELRDSEARFASFFQLNPLPSVIQRRSDNTVIDANEASVQLFGFPRAELVGRDPFEIGLLAEAVAARTSLAGDSVAGSVGREVVVRTRSGDTPRVMLFARPVVVAEEECLLLVAADLTGRDRVKALELQREVLEEAARAKSAFIASMNHELRTPLNAILGFSMLLMEQLDASTKHRGYLEHIYDAGSHLLALIGDVLDIARLDAGKIELRREPISLPGLLASALSSTQLAADAKGVGFTSSSPDSVMLSVDRIRIRQVLHNLLSNALKFTPAGGQVALRVLTEPGDQLVIEVSDTGVGIGHEDHGRVFGTFERFHEGVVDAPGTGLGLALTKQLVELHGGTIAFDSTRGVGSTFRVCLPGAVTRTLLLPDQERMAEVVRPS